MSIFICFAFFLILISPKNGITEVIFSDDFSSWPDYNFSADDYNSPGGWSLANGGRFDTHDGITHYCGEVKTPGRGGSSDRCLQVWKHGTFHFYYDGSLAYYKGPLHGYREIYVRWYMKIPSDFQLSEGDCYMNYLKMWRFIVGSEPGCLLTSWCPAGAFEIYLTFWGSSFSGAVMKIGKSANPGAGNYTLISVSDIRDGQWHCHELRIKLNTAGLANAEIQYWLDGIEKAHYSNLDYGASADDAFSSTGLGIGNTGARNCSPQGEFQEAWKVIEFDDYVLSTEYVGPSLNPLPPTGLRIIQ
jgi:hypothetical protein